jgi:hypothetical protein
MRLLAGEAALRALRGWRSCGSQQANSRISWQSAFGHGSLIKGRPSEECRLNLIILGEKTMLRTLLIATTAAAGLLSGGASKASTIYTYSFNNVNGVVAGTVAGRIFLPDGDGIFAAFRVFVDASPDLGIPDPTPFDVMGLAGFTTDNDFEVSGGAIVSAAFAHVFGPTECTALVMVTGDISFLNVYETCDETTGVLDGGSGTTTDGGSVTLSFGQGIAADVPLPATAPLALIGLAGLGLIARRRKAA